MKHVGRTVLASFAVIANALLVTPLVAQRADSSRTTSHERLFTRRDAIFVGAVAAATMALMPVDHSIATEMQEGPTQRNRVLQSGATGFRFMGSSGALLVGGALYGVGRFAHFERAADLGLHEIEAIAVGGAMTILVKGAVGRARPYAVNDSNAHDLQFLRGFRQGAAYSSFPSGHTTTGFAAAAVASAELSQWWPHARWAIVPVMYGSATLIGISRLYNNDHWASDVALAAGIGTLSGLKVVRYAHAHPHNRLDRWLLGTTISAAPAGGYAVGWSLPH